MINRFCAAFFIAVLSWTASADCGSDPETEPCTEPEAVEGSKTEAAPCLKEGENVTLTGTLVRSTFASSQDLERVEKGEHTEGYWFLKASKPIGCVEEADTGWHDWDSKFQLILSGDDYQRYRSLLGRPVVVSGKVVLADKGYHKTAILIEKESLLPEREAVTRRKIILH